MFKFAVMVCFGLGSLAGASAQVAPPAFPGGFRLGSGVAVHTSLSRQFMIREPDSAGRGVPISLGTNQAVHYVRVDATLLSVSCERIKHALLTELDEADKWHDRIYIDLRRARTLNDTIIIEVSPYGGSWDYHVRIPDAVESTRLVTGLVDVLLLEMANRNAGHSAELPPWLGRGLTEEILRSSHIGLVVEPAAPIGVGTKADGWMAVTPGLGLAKPLTSANFSVMSSSSTNTNVLAVAHEDLSAAPPLTLDQLTWPDESRLDGPEGDSYRSSAQLFVHDLLQLKDGRPAMRAFIQKLPQHLNWQLTFLDAFGSDFGSQLELEKWWALRLVDFTGRDIAQTMTPEESWDRLDEIIHPMVEVRTRVNELPQRKEMPLQAIIEKWDAARQFELLKERSKMLYLLRSRSSQELAKLVDDYRRTIDVYVDKRSRDGYMRTPRAQAVMGPDRVAQQTISDLNVLDSIREDLRPKTQTVQSADARKNINN